MSDKAIVELRDAGDVDAFLFAADSPVLLLVGSGQGRGADAVLAALCAQGPVGRTGRTRPGGGEMHAREFLTRIPLTESSCLVLLRRAGVLDLLRGTDVEAHGARWAAAEYAARFAPRLAEA